MLKLLHRYVQLPPVHSSSRSWCKPKQVVQISFGITSFLLAFARSLLTNNYQFVIMKKFFLYWNLVLTPYYDILILKVKYWSNNGWLSLTLSSLPETPKLDVNESNDMPNLELLSKGSSWRGQIIHSCLSQVLLQSVLKLWPFLQVVGGEFLVRFTLPDIALDIIIHLKYTFILFS